MARTLDGITVIDLSTGPAAALATMFLSDQGARVLRLVRLGEAHLREGGYIVWDRGKDVVTLDYSAPDESGSSAFRQLVERADVLIEDFAPGAPEQGLVARQALEKINPRLVSCSITAYGKHGPLKDEPPIDDLVLARMGVLGGMPGFRPAPVHVVHPLPTVGAALFAAIGIASALLAREETGKGRAVETSLMAGAMLYHPKVTGEHLTPNTFQTHPSGSAPFYSVYECADGKWVQLGCVHTGFIATAAKLFGISEKIKEPRFDQGRGGKTPADEMEMRDTLTTILKTRPYADWARDFEEADVPFAQARLSEEGLTDPQVVHNGMVVTLDDPAAGRVTQMGVPIAFSATPGAISGPRADKPMSAEEAIAALGPVKPPQPRRNPAPNDGPPLAGLRILEITNLIAGPTTGRLLADLGADVIKLEPPGGDLARPIGRTYFYNVNFNKRSVAVDTGSAEGKEVVQRIAASVDGVLANVRPGATERMGISAKLNPLLIETHLTGYGWTGPYSRRPGIDPLAQALMGLQRAQGGPENPPVFPAQLAPTDYTTGAMGALGMILAIFARRRTGVVQRVDSNLLSGGVVLSSPWFTEYAGKPERPLADKDQYGLTPFHRLFRMSDGWIYVVAENTEQEQVICALAGIDRTAHAGAGKHPNETPLARALADAFAGRPMAATLAALKQSGVPCAEAQPPHSELFLQDPHAAACGMVAVREHPTAGKLTVSWQYIQFPGCAPSTGLPTPLLGEHTDAVLREVEYSDAEIESLHAAGTVITEKPPARG